jgi:hypothetical protein
MEPRDPGRLGWGRQLSPKELRSWRQRQVEWPRAIRLGDTHDSIESLQQRPGVQQTRSLSERLLYAISDPAANKIDQASAFTDFYREIKKT